MAEKQTAEENAVKKLPDEERTPRCFKCGGRLLDYGYLAMPYRRCERCGAFWLDETLECNKCG